MRDRCNLRHLMLGERYTLESGLDKGTTIRVSSATLAVRFRDLRNEIHGPKG